MYFALVVFKKPDSLMLLSESKFLQTKVNTYARKSVGYMANPFLAGEKNMMGDEEGELSGEELEKMVFKNKMEEDGFTMVTQDETNANRTKGRDTFDNTVTGITQEVANRLVEEQLKAQKKARRSSQDAQDETK